MLNLQTFNCAGCSACANKCPVGAIKMKENKDGFYVPHIDKAKCTNCGLCEKICPENNLTRKNTKTPDCYAVMASDEIRVKSSSGGAFSVIAHKIFQQGGIVCGAAFDENWKVEHIIIDNECDMDKLRGSKYVQSFISEDLYKKLKKYLEDDRYVLFSGTPCQVAGFNKYLGKAYDKLLTVDIICSKVPPKKLFDKFLKDNYSEAKISNIKFRDKNNGWNCSTTTVTVNKEELKSQIWFKMYLNSLSMNESCVHCKYMSTDRVSDITIGDFWGIGNLKPELNDKKGTSCVLLNTNKGSKFFNELNWQKKQKMTVQNAVDGNRALCVPFIPNQNRKFFAENLENTDFNDLVESSLSNKKNIGILNWWWNSNRGAILTCWAIYELVKELGYNPTVIKHIPYEYHNTEYKNSISEKFAKKYLNLTEWCHSRIDMRQLNDKFETFMVGSDMVWNHKLNWFLQDFYYLNFAQINKNLISVAASFGFPEFAGDYTVQKRAEYYFKRFNAISVREKEGVTLLKNTFNIDGTFILDPVFLIDPEKYNILANGSDKKDKNFIAYYFVNKSAEKEQIVIAKQVAEKLNLKLIDMKSENSVEDWIYYIKNAKFVISDSFHCSAFSIIFNKPFMTVRKDENFDKDTRLKTLMDVTGTKHRFIKISQFNVDEIERFLTNDDFAEILNKIKIEKERSILWLKNAIKNPQPKTVTNEQEMLEAFYASLDDRINFLEAKCHDINALNSHINKGKYTRKYYTYRFFKNLVFGKLRKKYAEKQLKYKNLIGR